MTTLQISLPEDMKAWMEAQANAGRYHDTSDLVRQLVERERERADKIAAMQRLVDEARESGDSTETMAEIRERARRQARLRR